jgi:hypothetical protein
MAKKPPADPQSCASCKFFQPNQYDDAGWCRRFPPVPVATETGIASAQASTSDGEWCGEYSRKLHG